MNSGSRQSARDFAIFWSRGSSESLPRRLEEARDQTAARIRRRYGVNGNDDALSIKQMRSFVCYEHDQMRNQSDSKEELNGTQKLSSTRFCHIRRSPVNIY